MKNRVSLPPIPLLTRLRKRIGSPLFTLENGKKILRRAPDVQGFPFILRLCMQKNVRRAKAPSKSFSKPIDNIRARVL